MTSIGEALRRLRRRRRMSTPDPGFSYRVHWAGTVQSWDAARRGRVLRALRSRVAEGALELARVDRRSIVPDVDDQPHSGASLKSLIEVLQAYPGAESDSGEFDPPA